MKHDHNKRIMICTHVLEDYEPIGEMDDDIKSDTMICQKCCDLMCKEPFNKEDIPKEVHFACRHCVLEKIQGTISKVRIIKRGKK